MKRILLIHDGKSSDAHQIADFLKKELPDVGMMVPDLPDHPGKAMRFLNKLCYDSLPDVIIGVAKGANYAQHLHGYRKIIINPKNLILSIHILLNLKFKDKRNIKIILRHNCFDTAIPMFHELCHVCQSMSGTLKLTDGYTIFKDNLSVVF